MMSAVFPLALAFAVDPSWDMFLMTLGLILLLELISNNVIEPWLYGSSTGLSTLSIIVAATFWTALWGPIGLILSTPLTVCLLVLGRYIPSLKFMEVLLGSEPVLGPQQRLYQRLLADDADDAISMAVQSVEERLLSKPNQDDRASAVSGFYDEVAIPALRIATQQHLESATAEHRLRLSNGMAALLEELQDQYAFRSSGEHARAAPVKVISVDACAFIARVCAGRWMPWAQPWWPMQRACMVMRLAAPDGHLPRTRSPCSLMPMACWRIASGFRP
jgi:hypothetical protein